MADRTNMATGELSAGTRGLAAQCGVSQPTVVAAQRELQAAGVVERVELGRGSRPSRWRWKLDPPAPRTGIAQPVDNEGPRATSKALAANDESANGKWRTTSKALALNVESEYQDHAYTRVNSNSNGDELVTPANVPARVGTLREALRGGGRRGALSDGAARAGTTPAVAAGDELCATEADGWTP